VDYTGLQAVAENEFEALPEAYMQVKVLFFGRTADLAGSRESTIELSDGVTCGAALESIRERFPQFAGRRLLMAVNQRYAENDERIEESDELAVFTAVSGG
jgi:molybdopterin converting factor small subunit